MHCRQFQDASEFLQVAGGFLEERDPESNLILSNAYRLKNAPPTAERPAYMSLVMAGDDILAGAIMGYGLPLGVYAPGALSHEGMSTLVYDLLSWQTDVVKVIAPEDIAHDFAEVWSEKTGIEATPGMHMRLYALRAVRYSGEAQGKMRLAEEADRPLVAEWVMAMHREALSGDLTEADAKNIADGKVAAGQVFLWESGGQPVTMACQTRPTNRGIVLNGVFTPPEFRRRGFATSCVAAVSQHLLEEGYQFCSLFTDLTNPTSNSIYLKIGYEPIRDYHEYLLDK